MRTVPIGKGTDGLLQTADKAVRLLAARDGVKLPASSGGTGSGSGSSTDTIVIAIAAAVGALLVAGVRGRSPTGGGSGASRSPSPRPSQPLLTGLSTARPCDVWGRTT